MLKLWAERILRFFWTIWGVLIMSLLVIILFPIFVVLVFITPGRWKHRLVVIPHFFAHMLLLLLGIRLVHYRREQIDFDQQHIYIFNHSSNLDPLISGATVGHKAKFLGKAEILDYPVFGFILKHLYIAVRRDDSTDRLRSLNDLKKAISEGNSLIIYPEGTRNNSSDLLNDFHRGAFLVSIETQTPIVMQSCINSRKILNGNSWWVRPGVLDCYWDGAFHPSDYNNDLESYMNSLKTIMQKNMELEHPSGKFD